jgi:uncharacterized NAD-dependent epimerase/dehydratase family protein
MDLRQYKRLAILTADNLGPLSSKTAAGIIRYRAEDVAVVIDWGHAGQDLASILGWGKGIPILASLAEAQRYQPYALLIGIAPLGGRLVGDFRRVVYEAARAGMTVISGLHTMLRDDPELVDLAARNGAQLVDARDAGRFDEVATGMAARVPVKRVLTVGVDCAVGKMMTALELAEAAKRRGLDAAFVPTGQTGIMIAGWGISVDRVISDFAAGAAEWLVRQVAHKQICFVEGQGSIDHPGYSGVSLSLIHGSCPDAMVMCTRLDRIAHCHVEQCRVTDIRKQIRLCEELAGCVHPAKVVGVSVNTAGLSEGKARQQVEQVAADVGLPAADPIRYGVEELLSAVLAAAKVHPACDSMRRGA